MSVNKASQTIQERIGEKLKAEFAAIFTDEEWDNLVEQAYSDLTSKRDRGYNNPKTSDLEVMVRAEFSKQAAGIITEKIEARLTDGELSELITVDMQDVLKGVIHDMPSIYSQALINGISQGVSFGIQASVQEAITNHNNNHHYN